MILEYRACQKPPGCSNIFPKTWLKVTKKSPKLLKFNSCTRELRFNFLTQCVRMKSYLGNPAGVYLLKVNNRNIRKRCEVCSKLTIKTPGVFISLIFVKLVQLLPHLKRSPPEVFLGKGVLKICNSWYSCYHILKEALQRCFQEKVF